MAAVLLSLNSNSTYISLLPAQIKETKKPDYMEN